MPLQAPQQPMSPDMAQMAPAILRQRQQMIQLQEAAANGDPQAIQMLRGMQGAGAGGPPAGDPAAGGAPPVGGPPAMGAGGPPPAGPPPGAMTQSQFGNGGQPIPPDVQAARAAALIKLLRARGDR